MRVVSDENGMALVFATADEVDLLVEQLKDLAERIRSEALGKRPYLLHWSHPDVPFDLVDQVTDDIKAMPMEVVWENGGEKKPKEL